MPESKNNKFKSGFIAMVGRPNAGKSTLLNTIMGTKIAITSSVVQTTRNRIRAILNKDNYQAIFIDTPGLHKPVDVLGQELNEGVFQALTDLDVLLVLFDSSKHFGAGDKWVTDNIKKLSCPKICVLSKVDLIDDNTKVSQVDKVSKLLNWDAVVCLSSKDNYNIDVLLEEIEKFLPFGPLWFPKDVKTDQSQEMIIAEFIREKVLLNTYDEIPHSVGVDIDFLDYDEKKNLYKIYSNIYVEKNSQKGILIGKNANLIKNIGIEARTDLEKLLAAKVFLDLNVKVKKDWRKDYNQIRKLGYTSE